jgi:hypothetical protein
LILHFCGKIYSRKDPIHQSPEGANLLQTGPFTYILPEPPGAFVNHSCDPNAGILSGRSLVAIRAIAEHEEIRFDYSTTMDEDFWTLTCSCGAPGCRGVITDFRLLPRKIRRRYLDLGVVQRFIACKEEQLMLDGAVLDD